MPVTPKTLYEQRLREGAIKPDAAQASVVTALDDLYTDILAKKSDSAGFFQRLGLHLRQKSLRVPTPKQGVYIYGGVGRGKSMLMDVFYECLPQDILKRRVHFHEFMIGVHDYLHARREADDFGEGIDGALPALALRIAEKSRVLCFDEFHVTDVADAMILGRLFTALFERGVIVVATSNWPPDRLYEGGLQRDRFIPFITLLTHRLRVAHLDSPTDYRAAFLGHEDLYLTPLGEATTYRANALFLKLTGGVQAAEQHVHVKGRDIQILAARDVARVTFQQLCERPHGAEDYLKIAQTYQSVFLENIPKMGYDRRNEAKRLMLLIDALYENRTRVIFTAAAEPDKLYVGHDHAFEFQRTVSRLMEMSSADYKVRSS